MAPRGEATRSVPIVECRCISRVRGLLGRVLSVWLRPRWLGGVRVCTSKDDVLVDML